MKILLFFLLIIIFIIGVIFSKIEVKFDILQNIGKNQKINFKIIINLYLFYKVKILKISIDNKKYAKYSKNMRFNQSQIKFDKKIFKILKDAKIKIKYLKLDIDIDIINMYITTFLTVLISTVVSSFLMLNINVKDNNNCTYKVTALYQNKNLINIKLSSIIVGDFVHISNMIYKLIKNVRSDRIERTSNRRSYGYSNE